MLRKSSSTLLLIGFSALLAGLVRSSDDAAGQLLGGSLNSPIKLEVFSDFQCAACRELYLKTIRPVLQEYSSKDKVCVIYHEYPLSTHRYSREAARYSEAAARLGQDKLLPVLELLFTEQALWSQDGNIEATIAKALSHEDLQKVKKLVQDPSINESIDKQVAFASRKEVRATPTLFLYYIGREQKVEGLIPFAVLKQFFDRIVR